jgi:transcriptional regulator with XRE-family HTH domain
MAKWKSQHTGEYRRLLHALRQARKQTGLTQGDVAKHFGAYASFISKCEAGERRVDVIELNAFCKIYGIPIVQFLRSIGLA